MSDILKRVSAAMTAFSKIGKTNGSAPPEGGSNTLGIAYELMLADKLRKVSADRYDAAKAKAIEAGVLLDDYAEGTHVPYNSDGIVVTVRRNADSSSLDKTQLSNYLSRTFGADKALVAINAGMKPKKGATVITVGAG